MSYVLSILNFAFILLLVLFLFNILIVVHELGHFLAARWRGMVVEKFAVWFGKPIWSKKIGGVEYILGSIPAGGYVALPQMAPMETVEGSTNEKRENLPEASPLDKIIVAFAGPLFSFLLALVFACIVWVVGRPVDAFQQSTLIGWVKPGSGAETAGIQTGDRVISVDGSEVRKFLGMGPSLQWQVMSSQGDTIPVVLERDGRQIALDVVPDVAETQFWERGGLRTIGVAPGYHTLRTKEILPDSPAAKAGIQPGDQATHFNGESVLSTSPIYAHILDEENPGQPFSLTLLRDGQSIDVTVTPEIPVSPAGAEDYAIGVLWDPVLKLIYPTPWQQIVDSTTAIVETLAALLSPRSNVNASHLAGPIGIVNIYSLLFQSPEGWRAVLWLSVVINVNLAIFNLLPIPVLDGGHITLAILEWIRRKPLSMRILEPVQVGFALLLFGFIAYVSFYDVQDFAKNFGSKPEPIRFAPAETTGSQP